MVGPIHIPGAHIDIDRMKAFDDGARLKNSLWRYTSIIYKEMSMDEEIHSQDEKVSTSGPVMLIKNR